MHVYDPEGRLLLVCAYDYWVTHVCTAWLRSWGTAGLAP